MREMREMRAMRAMRGFAARALEHGCRLALLDRDFARFADLDRVRPGEG